MIAGVSSVDESHAVLDSKGRPAEGVPVLNEYAWMDAYEGDAHCVGYSVPGVGDAMHPRLNKRALPALRAAGLDPLLHWAIVDVDRPGHEPWEDVDGAWPEELDGLHITRHAGVYLTRAGYRIVFALDPPLPVDEAEAHLRGLLYALRLRGIHADEACTDWTRLFRMPDVVRDGVRVRYPVAWPSPWTPIDLRRYSIPSSPSEHAAGVLAASVDLVQAIAYDEAAGRCVSGGNNRTFQAVVNAANHTWPTWGLDAETIRDTFLLLPQAETVPGYEATVESAIVTGADRIAPVPAWLRSEMRRRRTRPTIRNFEWIQGDEGEAYKGRLPLGDIVADIHAAAEDWPGVVGGSLFAPREDDGIEWLGSTAELFAWLDSIAHVEWCSRASGIALESESHLLAGLRQRAPESRRYVSIADHEHEPPIPGVFYTRPRGLLEKGSGATLAAFSELLNADTDFDRDLLVAMLATPLWGGRPGSRPAFVLTTRHGRGVGKTSTAMAVAKVYGGAIWIDPDEPWSRVVERLLTDSAQSKRIALIDNLKGTYSRGDIESAITADTISGRKMYVGDSARPNLLTWIVTANAPALSSDLASRAVVVRIGRSKYGTPFEDTIGDLLDDQGEALIADLRALLVGRPKSRVPQDRFGAWCEGVLSRFAHGDELAELIQARREESDEERAEAAEVADAIFGWLLERPDLTEGEEYLIPSGDLLTILKPTWPDCQSSRALWKRLDPLLGNGALGTARRSAGRRGRGLLVYVDTTTTEQAASVPF
jgi:hypothetical protein